MEPVNNPTYQNGTGKKSELSDDAHSSEFGMTSPEQGGVVPILQQSSSADPPSILPSVAQAKALSGTDGSSNRTHANRTVFPSHKLKPSAQLFWYIASRRLLFGIPILRLIVSGLMFTSSFSMLGWLLGRSLSGWIFASATIACALWILVVSKLGDICDYVRFTVDPVQPNFENAPFDTPLEPHEKLPIHATGRFTVESKEARLTWVPGFYRTFATREHAIMCLVKDEQFENVAFWAKLGMWNPDELGMWYAFLTPDVIAQVQRGQLELGRDPQPALAIEYTIDVPATNFFQRLFLGDRVISERLYLACESDEVCDRICADLQHDLPHDLP